MPNFKHKAIVALVNEELKFLKLKPIEFRKLTQEQKNQLRSECNLMKNLSAFNMLVDFFIEQFKERIIKDEDPDYNRAGLLVLQGFREKVIHLANQYEGEEDKHDD
jgi:hypothetical protein